MWTIYCLQTWFAVYCIQILKLKFLWDFFKKLLPIQANYIIYCRGIRYKSIESVFVVHLHDKSNKQWKSYIQGGGFVKYSGLISLWKLSLKTYSKDGRRTPEPTFRNPRVGMLFNKWRQVWLRAMDRRRKLQDARDHLNEVCFVRFCAEYKSKVINMKYTSYIWFEILADKVLIMWPWI